MYGHNTPRVHATAATEKMGHGKSNQDDARRSTKRRLGLLNRVQERQHEGET